MCLYVGLEGGDERCLSSLYFFSLVYVSVEPDKTAEIYMQGIRSADHGCKHVEFIMSNEPI